jgi:hypothetical protein
VGKILATKVREETRRWEDRKIGKRRKIRKRGKMGGKGKNIRISRFIRKDL